MHNHTELEVLKSATGYYIGTFCPKCGPWSRVSMYYNYKEEAEWCLEDWQRMEEEADEYFDSLVE